MSLTELTLNIFKIEDTLGFFGAHADYTKVYLLLGTKDAKRYYNYRIPSIFD